MNIKRGMIKVTDRYELSKEDKLEIKSKYGVTKIFINDKEINYMLSYEITQSINKNIILKVTRMVTCSELEKIMEFN